MSKKLSEAIQEFINEWACSGDTRYRMDMRKQLIEIFESLEAENKTRFTAHQVVELLKEEEHLDDAIKFFTNLD